MNSVTHVSSSPVTHVYALRKFAKPFPPPGFLGSSLPHSDREGRLAFWKSSLPGRDRSKLAPNSQAHRPAFQLRQLLLPGGSSMLLRFSCPVCHRPLSVAAG